MASNSNNQYFEVTCPFLGYVDDQGTAMAFPSNSNYCHNCNPKNTPTISHQREFCLVENHINCILYASNGSDTMPDEIVFHKQSFRPLKYRTLLLFLVLTVAVSAFILILLLTPKKSVPNISTTQPVQLEVTPEVFTPTLTPTLKPTSTIQLTPTFTSTPVQLHLLETPISMDNDSYLLIHKVIEGETLIALAEKYNTSVDSIKAINADSAMLWAKSLWVIPINQIDIVEPHKYKAIQIKEAATTLVEIADQYSIELSELSKLNRLPENYSFQMDECVIIPLTQ